MNTSVKFHKQFGEVEIISSDATVTTIVIISTGEQKKLMTNFANLLIQDEPFKKAAKKVNQPVVELTQEDRDIVSQSVEREMKKLFMEAGMTAEQRAENAKYRQAGSSLRRY